MTKKRSSEISADENQEIFKEKVTFLKYIIPLDSGNASWSQGGWTPLYTKVAYTWLPIIYFAVIALLSAFHR